ncbi:hypothetical protein ACJIZ3_003511 [Penstemon smallii]|uniref:SWIM-type domain-containing protein n=1 Tax=Penstemon smallii TaxID=265156 RepID=A0ABD3UD98_9LAMI
MDVYRYGRLICNICSIHWGRMENNVGVDIFTDDPNNIRSNYVIFTNMNNITRCVCGIAIGWHLKCGIHFIPCQHIVVRFNPRYTNQFIDRQLTDVLPWARQLSSIG